MGRLLEMVDQKVRNPHGADMVLEDVQAHLDDIIAVAEQIELCQPNWLQDCEGQIGSETS